VISYSADTPRGAQAGSHAFAEAYLRNREDSAKADLDAQITALNTKIKQLNTTLTQVNRQLTGANRNSPDKAILDSQRTTAINQINSLAGKLNQLTTATVSAGKIISDAKLPNRPSKPELSLNLATGAMIGLLAGLCVATARQKLDRRVRRAGDVARASDVPVLAQLAGRPTPRLDEVFAPHGSGGRTFNRLRNEVLASLRPGDQVLVVTGASRGPAATVVAANLAAALARTGSEVVLIGAHLPDTMLSTPPLARLLAVQPTPGLSEVLAGKVGLVEAMQYPPRDPWLRVITTGGSASAAGLLQSQGLRDALDALRRQAEYVVVEAPSTSTSADAQSLASLADAAILAVELRRTRRPEVVDAAEQLRRVGTPLLGTVVVPRLPNDAPQQADPPQPAATPQPTHETQTGTEAEAATEGADTEQVDKPTTDEGTGTSAGPAGKRPSQRAGRRELRRPSPLRIGDNTDVLARLDSAVLAELDAQDGRFKNSNGSANGDHP
jgi:Mrp family chromosome partitioning ATPase